MQTTDNLERLLDLILDNVDIDDIDRDIFKKRTLGYYTYEALAKKYNVTRVRIQQREQRAYRKIYNHLESHMNSNIQSTHAVERLSQAQSIVSMFISNINNVLENVTDIKIESLELSVRNVNCLDNCEIRTISDLELVGESQLLRVPNFGRKSLNELNEYLKGYGTYVGRRFGTEPSPLSNVLFDNLF